MKLRESELDAAFQMILEGKTAEEATTTAKLQSVDFRIRAVTTAAMFGVPVLWYLKRRYL